MSEARECAMALLESGDFIQRELTNVRMDDATRASAAKLCSQLIGTKHDIIHELFDLDELLRGGVDEDTIHSRIDRIRRWLFNDVSQMHELVTTLASAVERDPECGGAYILVAESATNILRPFKRAIAAADLLTNADPTGNA